MPELRNRPSFQWIAIAGLSFAAMIVNSYYTSGVTANSVVRAQNAASVTYGEVVSRRLPICGLSPIKGEYVARFPSMEPLWKDFDYPWEIFRAMDEGVCNFGVVTKEMWEAAIAGYWQPPYYGHGIAASARACDNKTVIPSPSSEGVSIPIALPVGPELQHAISWALSMGLAEHRHWTALNKAKSAKITRDGGIPEDLGKGCATEASSGLVQLSFSDSIGPCFIAIASGLVAVMGNVVWMRVLRRHALRAKDAACIQAEILQRAAKDAAVHNLQITQRAADAAISQAGTSMKWTGTSASEVTVVASVLQ